MCSQAETKCLVMFSGGKDSFLTACELQQNYIVHLISFNNGCVCHEEIFKHGMQRLHNRFGDRIVMCGVRSTLATFQRLRRPVMEMTMPQLCEQFYKLRLAQLQCTLCQTSMWVNAIAYCIAKKIKHVACGYKASDNFCTGNELYKEFITDLCTKNDITVHFTMWDFDDESPLALHNQMLDWQFMPEVYETKCTIGLPSARIDDIEVENILRYIKQLNIVDSEIRKTANHFEHVEELGFESLVAIDYPTNPVKGLY